MFLGFLEVLRPNMRFIFHIDHLLRCFTVLDVNKGISLNLPSGDLSDEVYDVPLPGCYTLQIFDRYAERTRHFALN